MKILVFGASGSIGKSICNYLIKENHQLTRVSTSMKNGCIAVRNENDLLKLDQLRIKFDAIVYAQGLNFNDSIFNIDHENFDQLFRANVSYILFTLRFILNKKLIKKRSRICVISSIWQENSKMNKLSYSVAKSALRGLVLSAASDLGKNDIAINAILPGPIDNKMTIQNLSSHELSQFQKMAPNGKLVSLRQVAMAVDWLISKKSEGVNAQFIKLDNGMTSTTIM
jgi:3-oxoacyl-[acyl-carrier protein] reductase